MTDVEATNKAVAMFNNLSGDDVARLKDLNMRIQNHTGKWGVGKGGKKINGNTFEAPWTQNDPLIDEFVGFMDDKGLLIIFNWAEWDEGLALFVSEDTAKYDNIDLETALKLISVAIRKERFASGTLAWAFEVGGFPKLIKRLVKLVDTGARPE